MSKILAFITWRDTQRTSLLRVQFLLSVQKEDRYLVLCPMHRRFRLLSKFLPCHAERLAGGARGFCVRKFHSAAIYVFNVSMRNFHNAVNYIPAFLSSRAKPSHSGRKTILFKFVWKIYGHGCEHYNRMIYTNKFYFLICVAVNY